MDGIVPFRGSSPAPGFAAGQAGAGAELAQGRQAPLPPGFVHAASPAPALNPAASKGPADYLRAVRRRIWLVLVVAVPLAVVSSAWALRQPKIYRAIAEITIDPPQINSMLAPLVSRDISLHDIAGQERYTPNRIVQLQGQALAEKAVTRVLSAKELSAFDDPGAELFGSNLAVKPIGSKTNRYAVTLEGRDPSRTSKLLYALVEAFKDEAAKEKADRVGEAENFATEQLGKLKDELGKMENTLIEQLSKSRIIGPSGRNIFEEQYVNLSSRVENKMARIGELQQQLMISRAMPRIEPISPDEQDRRREIADLKKEKKQLTKYLEKARHAQTRKHFNGDKYTKDVAHRLEEIMAEIDELQVPEKTELARNPTQMILDHIEGQIENDRAGQQEALTRMQDSLPEHQKFLSMQKRRDDLSVKVNEMERNISSFKILALSQNDPVRIPAGVTEPTVPVKPNRGMLIAMGLIVSLGLGMGLVVLLEHVDHSVKVPEHVTQGLTLPLLGVVPRIRRSALTHRGGHLWTSGTPNSLEADSFRNVRASLLGAADRCGSIVTLLVTSPKSGDGKSTAALNLAATCARAGERTLLLDVDLRRPTLEDVFPPEPDKEGTHFGLVDVLQGTLPWQKTLRHTELPNLDFIPTGDPTGIPIEILGTLELRQLLAALSRHYDRVILDGPAVLGMADCRMLGRMVDAAILVVRAGAHPLVTLQRTKTMLELSHVPIAGVVVNGLSEGVEHWSSYGYEDAGFAPARPRAPALAASATS